MTANKARLALTLSLALALAACGGGGGGGGGDDDDDGGSGNPPAGFGDFDGSYSLYGTNRASAGFATAFDDTFSANFVDGEAQTGSGGNVVDTQFDFPLGNGSSGCFFRRGDVDTCVEQASGRVLALCSAPADNAPVIVGITETRDATFSVASIAELRAEALARGASNLRLRAVSCAGGIDASNSVTVFSNGRIISTSGGQSGELQQPAVDELFSASGRPVGNPESARFGARAFKYVNGPTTTYYVVNYGAAAPGGMSFPPFVFVSE